MINIPAMVAALFRREEWKAVGFMDYGLIATNKLTQKMVKEIDGRAVFLVSDKGKRRIDDPHKEKFKHASHLAPIAQMLAWEMGGPLPDDFKPHAGPERKPWKVPEEIRGQFNKEK